MRFAYPPYRFSLYEEQSGSSEYQRLSFEERLGLLVDREWSDRQDKRLSSRIKKARFRERPLWRTWI